MRFNTAIAGMMEFLNAASKVCLTAETKRVNSLPSPWRLVSKSFAEYVYRLCADKWLQGNIWEHAQKLSGRNARMANSMRGFRIERTQSASTGLFLNSTKIKYSVSGDVF